MSDLVKVGQTLRGLSNLTNNELDLTNQIWRDFDRDKARFSPAYGFFHLERGQGGTGAFVGTQATTGTGVFIGGPAGFPPLLEIDSNSATNGQGFQVQYTGLGVTPKDGMLVCFETMVRFKDIATGPEAFLGLATKDTTIIASDAISATDWIGFLSLTGGTLKFGCEDGTQDVSAITAHTMVDGDTTTTGAEWAHLGFRWRVNESFEVYAQRAAVDSSDVAIANEPDGAMVVSYVLQTNGTTDPIMEVAQTAFGFLNP